MLNEGFSIHKYPLGRLIYVRNGMAYFQKKYTYYSPLKKETQF